MQQASDFLSESEALNALVAPLAEADFARVTGFKSWTFETILRHLHFWNHMAHLSLTAPEEFQVAFKPVMEAKIVAATDGDELDKENEPVVVNPAPTTTPAGFEMKGSNPLFEDSIDVSMDVDA